MSDDDPDEGYDEAQRIPWFWRDLFLRRVSPPNIGKHRKGSMLAQVRIAWAGAAVLKGGET